MLFNGTPRSGTDHPSAGHYYNVHPGGCFGSDVGHAMSLPRVLLQWHVSQTKIQRMTDLSASFCLMR